MIVLSTTTPVWAADTVLESDTSLSTEGYFVLSWTSAPGTSELIVLQQDTDTGFTGSRERELPANGSLTITGLEDGHYYFRAGLPGDWSETTVVEVRHHSLGRAMLFFSVGLALFVILVLTIFLGNRSLGTVEGQEGGHHAG